MSFQLSHALPLGLLTLGHHLVPVDYLSPSLTYVLPLFSSPDPTFLTGQECAFEFLYF